MTNNAVRNMISLYDPHNYSAAQNSLYKVGGATSQRHLVTYFTRPDESTPFFRRFFMPNRHARVTWCEVDLRTCMQMNQVVFVAKFLPFLVYAGACDVSSIHKALCVYVCMYVCMYVSL